MTLPSPTKLAVLGSLNVDYFARVPKLPRPGETIAAGELAIRFGGKGANQAVAAARLGAAVSMLGRVGDDPMGLRYRERLTEMGIDAHSVQITPGLTTGSAFISVDDRGENSIVVAGGANGLVTEADVEAAADRIGQADWLLLQNEIPAEANLAAMRLARRSSTRILFNPAPWDDGFPFDECEIDLLVVNALEAEQLAASGAGVAPHRVPGMVVTRGSEPTLVSAQGEQFEVPTFRVEPIDTVGAGDAFVGGLGCALGSGELSAAAVRFANAAAALTTLQLGAQEAAPSLEQVSELLRKGSP